MITTRHEDVEYLNGDDKVAFRCSVPHGAGTRIIRVTVPSEVIVEIARHLKPHLDSKESGDRSHAVWHMIYNRSYPCMSCEGKPAPESK